MPQRHHLILPRALSPGSITLAGRVPPSSSGFDALTAAQRGAIGKLDAHERDALRVLLNDRRSAIADGELARMLKQIEQQLRPRDRTMQLRRLDRDRH